MHSPWSTLCLLYLSRLYLRFVLDVSSFGQSLSGKTDSGFSVYGQLALFARKLASRCLVSTSVPEENEWTSLVGLKLTSVKRIASRQFLRRMKLEGKVVAAANMKASNDSSEQPSNKESVSKLSDQFVNDFAILSRDYVFYLLGEVLSHVSLTADIVRGLASFDLKVLFLLPTSMAFSFFPTLHRSFSSRGWVSDVDEALCLEEYMSFVHDLRSSFRDLTTDPGLVHDTIDFLVRSGKLCSRPLLQYVFRLSCLCLTETSLDFPVVQFGKVDTSKLGTPMSETIYPVQSYLSCVPGCVESCARGPSVTQFLALCDTFGDRGFSSIYTPWDDLDFCGQNKFSQELNSSYDKIVEADTQDTGPKRDRILIQSTSGHRSIPIPKRVAGKVKYGPISQKEVDIVVSGVAEGGSTD